MNNSQGIAILLVILIVIVAGSGLYEMRQVSFLQTKLNNLQQNVANVQAFSYKLASTTQNAITPLQEFARRQGAPITPAKSQDQLLTAAVAKVAPSVTSVVISKSVPLLEVTYVNPFGDDPAFQDFGIRVPVYHQGGTTVQKVGAGSGFLVSADGYVVTNKHVVNDPQASYTVLLSDGSKQEGQVVYRDPKFDLAILKIPGIYRTIAPLGDSSSVTLGQTVIAIGNALGEYSNSVSVGIISGLNRTIEALDQSTGQVEQLTGVLQTDAAINPGNSGGPLIDLNGKVVGINVATVAGSNNIGFSIPINVVKNTIQNFVK